jgi:cysteine desulfurase
MVDAREFSASLRDDTAFAAVMWANNEVGTMQPTMELAGICAERAVPFHSDAVQAAGRVDMDVGESLVSTLALSAHKIYGPQGAGALYVREGLELSPVLFGGGQENGLRSGTENVAAIVGFGEAARLAREERGERIVHEAELRDRIVAGAAEVPGVRLNGHPEARLSNNVHLTVDGVEAESLVLMLDALGYAVGKGSACSSSGHKASPVLEAMGQSEAEAFSALRISTGKENTAEEVEGFLETFTGCIERLRELSPIQAS